MIEALANSTVAIMLQYINVSNQHVHVKLTQYYMSIFQFFKKKTELDIYFITVQKK